MKQVPMRLFKAMTLSGGEPLSVTSHGIVVGTWYPAGTEPRIDVVMEAEPLTATTGHLGITGRHVTTSGLDLDAEIRRAQMESAGQIEAWVRAPTWQEAPTVKVPITGLDTSLHGDASFGKSRPAPKGRSK